MSVDPKKIVDRFNQMKTDRSQFDNTFEDIVKLVRPNTNSFQGSNTPGDEKGKEMYDSTAPWAAEQLAGGLNTFLTSPTERWFSLSTAKDPNVLTVPRPILAWLERVSDIIYSEYARPDANFHSAIHEGYLDLSSFGTGVLYQEYSMEKGSLCFYCYPLASCYFSEGKDGVANFIIREFEFSVRQLLDKFPDTLPKHVREEKNLEKKFKILHCVMPRTERHVGKLDGLNKAFASVYILKEGHVLLSEGGYDSMPYHVARWTKVSGETYGRSPAWTALPDIRVLNTMARVVLKAGQKIVDPPLMVPDDGFLMPIKTSPGSLIFFTPGTDPIIPLETKGRPDIGLDMMDQKREAITRMFYVDYIIRQKKKERQSATEIQDERGEMLRQMAPMLGRISKEWLSPILRRSFMLLHAVGRIPEPPMELLQYNYAMAIEYTSPAAKAQLEAKANTMGRYIQEVTPLASLDPSVLDAIDLDAFVQETALLRGVSRTMLRSEEQIIAVRQQRAERQQAAEQAALAEQSSSTLKNIAQANSLQGATRG